MPMAQILWVETESLEDLMNMPTIWAVKSDALRNAHRVNKIGLLPKGADEEARHRLPPSPDLHHLVLGRLAADQSLDMVGPALEGVALLVEVVVALIDPDNATECSAAVVENLLDDFNPNAEPLHPGGDTSAHIMQRPPLRELGAPIEIPLEPTVASDRSAPIAGEDEVAADKARLGCNDAPSLRRQRYCVWHAVLDALARQIPKRVAG